MTGTHVVATELRDFSEYLHRGVVTDLDIVRMDARYEGCSGEGFTFLLSPLADVMGFVGTSLVNEAFEIAKRRMRSTADGLKATAYSYGLTEVENQERIDKSGKGGVHAL